METESIRRSSNDKAYVWLTSIPLPEADANKLDAFQMKGLRKILKIKHPSWSIIFNKKLLEIANDKPKNEQDKSCLERLSKRFIERHIALIAHTIRFDEQFPPKIFSVDETEGRVRSYFRRKGGPRTKLYDTMRNHTIKKLIKEGHLPRNVSNISIKQELNEFIIQMAQDRHI